MLWIRILLILSGLYDGLLGVVVVVAPSALFTAFHVTPPNHFGYVQFPALMLIIFGVMFLRAAANPVARRELIAYGIALKASYSGLVFWYQFHGGVPNLWIPWAWADLLFLVLFFLAWRQAGAQTAS